MLFAFSHAVVGGQGECDATVEELVCVDEVIVVVFGVKFGAELLVFDVGLDAFDQFFACQGLQVVGFKAVLVIVFNVLAFVQKAFRWGVEVAREANVTGTIEEAAGAISPRDNRP